MSHPVRIAITHGDPNGVGYEVTLKALAEEGVTELCTPVIFGNSSIAQQCISESGLEDMQLHHAATAEDIRDNRINIIDVCSQQFELTPGQATPQGGRAAVEALEAATGALKQGIVDALVTAPICKQSANSDSFPFPGHTEYLENKFGRKTSAIDAGAEDSAVDSESNVTSDKALMILFNDILRVALVSTHLPIADVARAVTRDNVSSTIARFDASLRRDFNIQRPKIAVLSLNPHCGDGGLLGQEEQTEITPAIADCRSQDILAFGPMAADGFFASGAFRSFDGVVAMYHDQGLAPFKALAGDTGVNFTAGLDIVRTSPDHGTAFDIAWQGKANPQSMRQAIFSAIDIVRARRRSTL